MRTYIGSLFLLLSLPLAAHARSKPTGKIPDVVAFNNVRTYCIDTSELSGPEAYDVKGFIRRESRPKGLLTKLPWKLQPDCREGSPDAIAKISFHMLNKIGTVIGTPSNDELTPMDPYALRAYLQVFGGETQKLLYELEAAPLDNPEANPDPNKIPDQEPLPLLRRNAAYRAFWTMIGDLQITSKNGKN